ARYFSSVNSVIHLIAARILRFTIATAQQEGLETQSFPSRSTDLHRAHPMRPFARHPFSLPLRVGLILLVLAWSSTLQAKETDEDMPVVAVGGPVHVDLFSGTATTSLPIEVPPGRNGIQPNLNLAYESANGNGWVGMGWKLELGAIERRTRFGLDYSGVDYTFRLSGVSADLVNIGL